MPHLGQFLHGAGHRQDHRTELKNSKFMKNMKKNNTNIIFTSYQQHAFMPMNSKSTWMKCHWSVKEKHFCNVLTCSALSLISSVSCHFSLHIIFAVLLICVNGKDHIVHNKAVLSCISRSSLLLLSAVVHTSPCAGSRSAQMQKHQIWLLSVDNNKSTNWSMDKRIN